MFKRVSQTSGGEPRDETTALWAALTEGPSVTSADALNSSALEALERDVCRALRRRRVELGLSQIEVGDLMTARGFGMHQTTVGKIEAGQRPLRLAELWAFSVVLRIPWTDLAGPSTAAAAEAPLDLRYRTTRRAAQPGIKVDDLRRLLQSQDQNHAVVAMLLNTVAAQLMADENGSVEQLVGFLTQGADIVAPLTDLEARGTDGQAADADQ